MNSLHEANERVRAVCLGVAPIAEQLAALGGEPARWRVYRRMVRARLRETLAWAFERVLAIVGEDELDAWIEAFLAERPPTTAYLRDVPGELLAFLEGRAEAFAIPPDVLAIARYEVALREVAAAAETVDRSALVPLAMDLPVALTAALRLLVLDHAAHRETAEAPPPYRLCVYRDPTAHEARTLELSPFAATLLAEASRADAPFVAVVRRAADAHGLPVDEALLASLSELVADLLARGVVLGSVAPPRTPPNENSP